MQISISNKFPFKKRFSIFQLIFFSFILFNNFQSFSQKKILKSDFEKDLDYAKDKLEKYYLGMYYYESKLDFEDRLNKIRIELPNSLTAFQAYQKVGNLVAGLKDLHTGVYLPKSIKNKKNLQIPLYLRKYGDDFFIHYNTSNDSTILRGSKILNINGLSPITYYKQFTELYGVDNGNNVSKGYYAERSFPRYFNNLIGVKDSISITYQAKPDSAFTTKKIALLPSKTSNKILSKRYKNATRKNMDFKIIDSTYHIAKLDITSFIMKGNKFDILGTKFKKEIRKRFKEIEKKGVEHLIVDFRANGGGLISNITQITKYVAKEPFKLDDSSYFKKDSYFKLFPIPSTILPIVARFIFKPTDQGTYLKTKSKTHNPAKKYHFDKNLYVLMDGGSYSATTFTIGLWRDMNLATFVGTRPGGANWGSFAGQWHKVTLPKSKVIVRIPLIKIVHAQKHKTTKSFFVEPDYNVEQGFSDFLKRKDTQLDFTLDLIKNK